MNNKTLLKKAFIEANCECYPVIHHNFSADFQSKMEKLIKSQHGLRRLVNTSGKRAAVIILAVIISLTGVACTVEEVREPIVKTIKEFFVDAKQLLTDTPADNVSELFPSDISKIKATSYMSKSQKEYLIEEQEKVTKFITLLSYTYWGEPRQFDEFNTENTYWTFDFYDLKGENVLTIKMCNDSFDSASKVAIIKDGKEYHYLISNETYAKMLAFTSRRFYLHDSNLELPDDEYCKKKQMSALVGFDETEHQKIIKKKIRDAHYSVENLLISKVSFLKKEDSIYWDYLLSGEKYIDPIANYETQDNTYRFVSERLEYLIDTVKDKETKKALNEALELWCKSMKNHDLEGLFTAHEYIHDYDYFVFNYPTKFVYDNNADFQGLKDYFGRIK